ncbi:MAG TPA: hypothetical protein DCE42_03360 [Myxococcales bacterium]|nr:hypothetical protein [Deltaproteobacteria bacterium]MBU48189.1 hypothetical protein [Deltaproteobacteria bacterium]HAA53761.1 hypothetical protein [Myxococcales bacterium]
MRTLQMTLCLGCFVLGMWSTSSPVMAKKKKNVPAPPIVQLPGLNLKQFNVYPKIFIRKKPAKRKGRYRPPTRGGDTPKAFLSVKTTSPQTANPKGKTFRERRRGGTKPQTADDAPETIRLVVYTRKWGRHAWRRQWMGHIMIGQGSLRYISARPTLKKKLRRIVAALQRSGIRHPKTRKRLRPKDNGFAWALRKQLERKHRFEIVTQTILPKGQ